MLSLPLLPPQPTSQPLHPARPDSPPPHLPLNPHTQPQQQPPSRANQHRNTRHNDEAQRQSAHPLTLLNQDESAIAARKHAIAHFGSLWIRPPGIAKTLAATNEEEAERLEQEEMARQEQGMRDLAARQEMEEARERAAQGGHGEGEEERDLDEDIPEAEEVGEATGEVSFNDESVVEGSSQLHPGGTVPDVEGTAEENDASFSQSRDLDAEIEDRDAAYYALETEEAELTGAARDEEALGIVHEEPSERNLDDSVPEAGAYEHTDTELESSTDEEGDSSLHDSFAAQSARRSATSAARGSARASAARAANDVAAGLRRSFQSSFTGNAGGIGSLQERMRAQVGAADALPRSPGSVDLGSSLLESSFVGSSPVLQRGAQAGRGRGGRRGRGGSRMS